MTPAQKLALALLKVRALQAEQCAANMKGGAPADPKLASGVILADLLAFITDLSGDMPAILQMIAAIEAMFAGA